MNIASKLRVFWEIDNVNSKFISTLKNCPKSKKGRQGIINILTLCPNFRLLISGSFS